ncbi:MAG: putative DNA binding domain-containing protein [Desulfuromusa sp.]|nr:putative DNA binding domain-containing protein [Desulfuromusa sp.]
MTIEELLQHDEGKILEFKRDLSSPQNLLKALVAFANTAGGKVIVGVDDKTRLPTGVDNPLDEEERLCNLIADSISPRLVPNIEMTTVAGKTLLVVEVFLSGSRPHYLKTEGPKSGVYVRLGSTNRQADRELIAELRRTAEGVAFDELPLPDLSIDDLDLAAIKVLFLDKRELDENDLFTLRLLTKEQGRFVPTKGAILLFGKDRERYFPDAWVQCGRFVGKDKAEIFDHIELYDHLPQAVDSIMLFLKKHAMRSADFSEIRRKDVWSIPLGILREVVINALVHADYSQRGAPIRIAFFDDRIEIENPGILLPGMTIDDMRQGVSKIRNHVIARMFRELNLIEQWGSGVRRIFREAEEQGLPVPEIVEVGMRMRFIVPLAEPLTVQANTEQERPESRPESELESRLELKLESRLAAKVIILLHGAESGKSQLANGVGHRSVSGELKKQIKRLLGLELIEMTIPGKPNSSLQKYRLTAKGMTALNEQAGSETGQ